LNSNLTRLICPHNAELFGRVSGRILAVREDDPARIAAAAADVISSGNQLLCIIHESKTPLDRLAPREDWEGIPLALFVPELGKFQDLAKKIPLLRKLNLRVYLSANRDDNLTALRVLSSIGIPGCALLDDGVSNWEALSDLMTYALLGPAPHAPIEPFASIARHYDPRRYMEWGSACFDDPKRFRHLDDEGRVALSRRELRERVFIANDLDGMEKPGACPEYAERLDPRRRFFLEDAPCARCEAFRVCLGRFAPEAENNGGCSAFFTELMEVAEQYQGRENRQEEQAVWQP
jgi:hypothetical protein